MKTKISRPGRVSLGLIIILIILIVLGIGGFFVSAATEAATLSDGDLIRGPDGIKVYIINNYGYKRHILNPKIFNMYGHLKWSSIKEVDQKTLDSYQVSNLYRLANDYRVFSIAADAKKHHLNMTAKEFEVYGYSWNQVFIINEKERTYYIQGDDITGVKPEEKKETPPIVLPNLTPPVAWPDWLKKEWENNIEEIRRTQEELGMVGMHNENLPQLLQWADKNQIRVIKSGNYQDVAEGSLVAMPFIDEAYEGFKQIPPHLIKFLQNETVNFTNRSCMTGAGVVNIGVKEEIKMKVNFTLCRSNINGFVAVHEVGHIVDEFGIRNKKGNEFSFGKTDEGISAIREEYDRIFQVSEEYQRMYSERLFTAPPPGFTTVYSTRSESENFADHFSDYIFGAQYFRERAAKEPLLAEKYEFLKTKIFLGKEY